MKPLRKNSHLFQCVCSTYRALEICPDTVAVADDQGILFEYLYTLRQKLSKKVSKGNAGVNLTAAIKTGLRVSEKGTKQNEVGKAARRKQQPSQKSLSSVLTPAIPASPRDPTMPSTSMVQDEFFPGARDSTIDWPEQTTSVPFVVQSAWSMPTLNYPFSQQIQTRGSPWPHYQQVQHSMGSQLHNQQLSTAILYRRHQISLTRHLYTQQFLVLSRSSRHYN